MMNAPFDASSSPWLQALTPSASPENEARTLVVLMRSSRLTLLRGAAGAERDSLLHDGVMPLLQRRASDEPWAGAARVSAEVLPFPDRRSQPRADAPQAEIELALLLDEWHDQPLDALHAGLAASLGITPAEVAAAGKTLSTRLVALGNRFGARFCLVCDRFEAALLQTGDDDAGGLRTFLSELVDAIRAPQSPAHVLLAVSEAADAALGRMRRQFPGFDGPPMRLSHWDPLLPMSLPSAPLLASAPPAPVRARPAVYLVPPATEARSVLADPPSLKLDDWAASLDQMMASARSKARDEPAAGLPASPQGLPDSPEPPELPALPTWPEVVVEEASFKSAKDFRASDDDATLPFTSYPSSVSEIFAPEPLPADFSAAEPTVPAAAAEPPEEPPTAESTAPALEPISLLFDTPAPAEPLDADAEADAKMEPAVEADVRAEAHSDVHEAEAEVAAVAGHAPADVLAEPVVADGVMADRGAVDHAADTAPEQAAPNVVEAAPVTPLPPPAPMSPPSPPLPAEAVDDETVFTARTVDIDLSAAEPVPAPVPVPVLVHELDPASAADDVPPPRPPVPPEWAPISPRPTFRKPAAWIGAAVAAALLLWFAWPAGPRSEPPLAALTAPRAVPAAAPRPATPAPAAAVPAPTSISASAASIPAPASTTSPTTSPTAAPPSAVTLVAAPPVAAPSALPTLTLATAAEDGAMSPLAADLQRWAAPAAGLNLRTEPASGWADSLAAPNGSARLAIVHYDALQAERVAKPGAALRLVAPLVPEALYFVVRVDSPLKDVTQIERAKINLGPAAGGRALTAQSVYQRLFQHTLPAAQSSFSPRDAALKELLDARSIDVMLLVDAQPSAWLAGLPPARAAALKLLPLAGASGDASANAATRRALQAYLPATLAAAGALPKQAVPGLSVMSFLVASGQPAGTALQQLASALCSAAPALRSSGHPAWQAWQPGLQLPAGWPYESFGAAGTGSAGGTGGTGGAAGATPSCPAAPRAFPSLVSPARTSTTHKGASS